MGQLLQTLFIDENTGSDHIVPEFIAYRADVVSFINTFDVEENGVHQLIAIDDTSTQDNATPEFQAYKTHFIVEDVISLFSTNVVNTFKYYYRKMIQG